MRRGTDPIEPGHVSIESPIFAVPFTRLADARLSAGNDPLRRAGLARTRDFDPWDTRGLSLSLKVSHPNHQLGVFHVAL